MSLAAYRDCAGEEETEIPATGTAQVGVNASGLFPRSSRMRFTTSMYNAAPPLHLIAQIKVMRGTEAVIAPPEIKINADKVYTGEFFPQQPRAG